MFGKSLVETSCRVTSDTAWSANPVSAVKFTEDLRRITYADVDGMKTAPVV